MTAQTTEKSGSESEDNQVFYDPGLTRKEQLQLRREEMEAARGAEDQERQSFVQERIEDISGEEDEDDDW
jgi:hypothetical protein